MVHHWEVSFLFLNFVWSWSMIDCWHLGPRAHLEELDGAFCQEDVGGCKFGRFT